MRKRATFWKKAMDKFLCKFSIFLDFFQTLLFQSKNYSFLPRISKKEFFVARFPTKTPMRKMEIFPKGLVHRFGQKLAIFLSIYLRQYRTGKCVLG